MEEFKLPTYNLAITLNELDVIDNNTRVKYQYKDTRVKMKKVQQS